MTNQKRVRKTPEERRADVHGAARSIALESGLSAVTQRAVAERVGVAPALITHYVSRMELLVAEVFRDIAQEELAGVLVEEARAWEEFVAGIFARGDAAGAFSAPEPLALARFVVGATDGLSAQSAVWAGYEDETARYVVETVAALLRIPAGDAPRTASY